MKKKKVIGIEINEVIREHLNSFENMYTKEYGKDAKINRPFTNYDYLQNFTFTEKTVDVKYLKSPEITNNVPDELYHTKDENGNIKADKLIFDTVKEKLTKKNQLDKFMYEDYIFELFASPAKTYVNINLDIAKFYNEYSNEYDIKLISVEDRRSVPLTLHFLSRAAVSLPKYQFYQSASDVWSDCDVVIATNPDILNKKPFNKISIKVNRDFNETNPSNNSIDKFDDIFNLKRENFKINNFSIKNLKNYVQQLFNKK